MSEHRTKIETRKSDGKSGPYTAPTKLFRAVLDSMQEGVVAAGTDGRFLVFNAAAKRIIGLGPTALPRERWAEHYGVYLDDGSTLLAPDQGPMTKALAGQSVEDFQFLIRNERVPEGVYVRGGASPLRGADGRIVGAVAIFRDVTARRRAEEALQRKTAELARSNAELDQFASAASHDLLEPLRKVIAFGDLLEKRAAPSLDPVSKDFLGRMRAAATRMAALIEDLLRYSRLKGEERPLERIRLNDVVSDALVDLEGLVRESGAEVSVGELPAVEAHPFQMRQLFQNLLANALKFRRKEASPRVAVEEAPAPPGFVAVRVVDNGIGFAAADAERIFDPFVRLHARAEYEGSGLGLAICRKIAQLHGGAISARAMDSGGATFTVTLPRGGRP